MLTTDLTLGRRLRQSRFNPLRSLTPATLATALDQYDVGYLRQAALLWEAIEQRDDVLQIAGPKRRSAVSRRPWEILLHEKDDETGRAHAATLTGFYRSIRCVNAADENCRGGFTALVKQIITARFCGYSAHEVIWKPQARMLSAELRFVPLYFFENTTGRLRYVGPEGGLTHGTELPEDEWLISGSDTALMKAASICYLFKRLSLQDWLNFSEKFGIPGIHGETNATHGGDQWDKFVAALDSYASDWITATSMGEKINLIETKTTGDAPFAPMVERMDRRLAALCRGADLSTLSRGGENTGASLQGDEQDIYLEDDCEFASESLEPLSRFVIRYVHGEEPRASLIIHPPAVSTSRIDLDVDTFLVEAGAPIGVQDAMERYRRSMPAAGAPVLALPGTTAPAATKPAENDLVNRLSVETGSPVRWFESVGDLLANIERRAADRTVTDEELLTLAERAAHHMPELLTPELILEIARPLENRMSAAALDGARDAVRKKAQRDFSKSS